MIDGVLRNTESFAGVDLHDIVCSKSLNEHLKVLSKVVRHLEEAGLTTKEVNFCLNRLHLPRIPHGERRCCKVQAVAEMLRPQSKKYKRTFLGMTGYYIRDYATIAEPKTALMRKN